MDHGACANFQFLTQNAYNIIVRIFAIWVFIAIWRDSFSDTTTFYSRTVDKPAIQCRESSRPEPAKMRRCEWGHSDYMIQKQFYCSVVWAVTSDMTLWVYIQMTSPRMLLTVASLQGLYVAAAATLFALRVTSPGPVHELIIQPLNIIWSMLQNINIAVDMFKEHISCTDSGVM